MRAFRRGGSSKFEQRLRSQHVAPERFVAGLASRITGTPRGVPAGRRLSVGLAFAVLTLVALGIFGGYGYAASGGNFGLLGPVHAITKAVSSPSTPNKPDAKGDNGNGNNNGNGNGNGGGSTTTTTTPNPPAPGNGNGNGNNGNGNGGGSTTTTTTSNPPAPANQPAPTTDTKGSDKGNGNDNGNKDGNGNKGNGSGNADDGDDDDQGQSPTDDEYKPGCGKGDKNHDHTGPPGEHNGFPGKCPDDDGDGD